MQQECRDLHLAYMAFEEIVSATCDGTRIFSAWRAASGRQQRHSSTRCATPSYGRSAAGKLAITRKARQSPTSIKPELVVVCGAGLHQAVPDIHFAACGNPPQLDQSAEESEEAYVRNKTPARHCCK
jgi:hypothetical protein